MAFVRRTASSRTAADNVVQFVPAGTETASEINKVFLKETEKAKYRPSTIVKQMKAEGFAKFGMKQHTDLWKSKDAKNAKYPFGVLVEGTWFWYETWLTEVRKHCHLKEAVYKAIVPAGSAATQGRAARVTES